MRGGGRKGRDEPNVVLQRSLERRASVRDGCVVTSALVQLVVVLEQKRPLARVLRSEGMR